MKNEKGGIPALMEKFYPLLDVQDAMKRLGNNKSLFAMLLKKFSGDTMLEDLKNKLADGDADGAQAQAHAIKGLAANLSLEDLRGKAEYIESALRDGAAAAEIDAAEIAESTAATAEAIKVWLSENN